ncbi:hypothetical protein EBH_0085590 [Eimeria brunetti]|uniref:Uncharacterized protein n=1 Tax=Eimeria brunetti TaxID=51314 RepID=U6M2E5_9EIME|nr:hypothetical protein EBH_0085590 [Eimeria brunetti]
MSDTGVGRLEGGTRMAGAQGICGCILTREEEIMREYWSLLDIFMGGAGQEAASETDACSKAWTWGTMARRTWYSLHELCRLWTPLDGIPLVPGKITP